VTAIGFSIYSTAGQSIRLSLVPLGLAVFFWSLSVFLGLKFLSYVISNLYTNIAYLDVLAGNHSMTGKHPQKIAIGKEWFLNLQSIQRGYISGMALHMMPFSPYTFNKDNEKNFISLFDLYEGDILKRKGLYASLFGIISFIISDYPEDINEFLDTFRENRFSLDLLDDERKATLLAENPNAPSLEFAFHTSRENTKKTWDELNNH